MTLRSLSLAALAAAALLAAGCGGSEEEVSGDVAWADGVCTSVSTWLESVESAATSLQEDGTVEERVDAALEDVRGATDELGEDLRELEPPDVGEQATASLDELLDELGAALETIEEAADGASDPADALAALATIGTTVGQMSEAVSSTLDELRELDADATLAEAFDEADSCDDLRREGS